MDFCLVDHLAAASAQGVAALNDATLEIGLEHVLLAIHALAAQAAAQARAVARKVAADAAKALRE
eukprot:9688217-Alexandrium_andersonii.AAC.1